MENITPEAFWTLLGILGSIAVFQNIKERIALRKDDQTK